MATIRSYNNRWDNARIVGYGKDSFTGQKDIVLVQHPQFGAVDLEFYINPDEDGKCHNVGNAAYWLDYPMRELYDAHKYDYLHAEEPDWKYRDECHCERCLQQRQTNTAQVFLDQNE